MKRNLAFGPINFILLGISVALVIIGFILMSGDSTTAEKFNSDIFSSRRIVVAPILCLFGFLSMIVAVMYRKKENENENETPPEYNPTDYEVTEVEKTKIDLTKKRR